MLSKQVKNKFIIPTNIIQLYFIQPNMQQFIHQTLNSSRDIFESSGPSLFWDSSQTISYEPL